VSKRENIEINNEGSKEKIIVKMRDFNERRKRHKNL